MSSTIAGEPADQYAEKNAVLKTVSWCFFSLLRKFFLVIASSVVKVEEGRDAAPCQWTVARQKSR